MRKKLYIVTDAWKQINGVCTTLHHTAEKLEANHECEVRFITFEDFKLNFKLFAYKEITLCLPSVSEVEAIFEQMLRDNAMLHIATEGPLGLAFRLMAARKRVRFTTSYHTNFPEYLQKSYKIPTYLTYPLFKWFHKLSSSVLVTNKTMQRILTDRGFDNTVVWSRGVDTNNYSLGQYEDCDIDFIYVGRISEEKNIEQFLKDVSFVISQDPSITKVVVVGDGPRLEVYKKQYSCSQIQFVGAKTGAELVDYYKRAKIKVFPSKTDTFGLVILESLSCGAPVVAYNTTGPSEVLNQRIGMLVDCSHDLTAALKEARLNFSNQRTREACREHVENNYSWDACTQTFFQHITEMKNAIK